MGSQRWRKVLADLWANKTRTALAVLSIAIGVFAVGAVAATFSMMNRDIARSYQAANPAAATIYAWPDFDDDLLVTVRHVPGVADVEGVATLTVRVKQGPERWRPLTLYAVADLEQMRVNTLRPVSGAWPAPRRQVLLERSTTGLITTPVGAALTVELADGSRRALPVAGVVHDATAIPAFFSDQALGFVSFDTLEWLGGRPGYSQMAVTLEDRAADLAAIKAVTAQIEARLESAGRGHYIYIPPPGESPLQPSVDAMSAVLSILAGLMVILSMFLIVNTVGALLLQQRRQIGVMKAIGASTGQLVVMYLAFVLALGLLALLLAVPLAALDAQSQAAFMAGLLNYDPGPFVLFPQVVALQAALALAMPLLAAIIPVVGGARTTVYDALAERRLGRGRFGRGRLDRLLERVRFLSRPLLLSLRNTFRRKGRLALTLITLTLAGAIFIGVGSTQAAVALQVDEFMNYFGEDVRISFARRYRIDQVTQIALGTPGVARTELWAVDSIHRLRPDGSSGESVQLIGPQWGSALMRPKLLRGRWLLEGDENAIVVDTKLLGQERDVDLGSRLTMRMGDEDTEWVVVGVVPQLGNGSPIAYTNYSALTRLWRNVGWTGDLRVVAARHDAASQRALANALQGRFTAAGVQVRLVQTAADFRANLEQQFSIIVMFLLVTVVQIAVVGGIGLMGTMSMNVVERTRELGVLRAIGASNGALQRIIVAEGLLVGLLSWALAALLAVPISRLLTDGVGLAFLNAPLPAAFSPAAVAAWLLIALALAALASALPAWRAAQLTVRDVLAYE